MARHALDLRPCRGVESAEFCDFADCGTCLANYSYDPSCDPTRTDTGRRTPHGGARNRADRTSEFLTRAQSNRLWDAFQFAILAGLVFQRHWTINYQQAGIMPEHGAEFVGKLLDLVGKQARRDGGKLTAIWVRECGGRIGEHVHILMHLPTTTRLQGRTKRWIELAGGVYVQGVSKIKYTGGSLRVSPNVQIENAENIVRYLLKGVGEKLGRQIGLSRFESAGIVVGKRCGTTQNIGLTARRRASFEH